MSALDLQSLFSAFDPEELDDRAAKLVAVLVGVAEFARPASGTEEALLFEAAWVRALLTSLAAWIAHPHQDEEQHGHMLEGAIDFLRKQVVELGTSA